MASPRIALRLISTLLIVATAGYWFAAGAHRGWSMDKVPVEQVDEITGLNYTTYEDRYVPGIEVLGAGVVLGGLILVGTLFGKSSARPKSS